MLLKLFRNRLQIMHHIPIALVIQFCTYLLGFDLWAGAAAGMWYFIGREYAQAEYRLIEHYYGGKRANMPTFAPLKETRAWDKKSITDWVTPAIAVLVVAFFQNDI